MGTVAINCRPYSDFTNCLTRFPNSRIKSKIPCCIYFVSLILFDLPVPWSFLCLLWPWHFWHFWRGWTVTLQNVPQFGFVSCFLMILLRLWICFFIRSVAVSFPVHLIKGFRLSIWFITGGVNLDHLVNVLCAGFLHCEGPVFQGNIWMATGFAS